METVKKVMVTIKEDFVNHFKKGDVVEAEKVKFGKKDQYRKFPLDMPKFAYRLFHKETKKSLIIVWPQFVDEIVDKKK